MSKVIDLYYKKHLQGTRDGFIHEARRERHLRESRIRLTEGDEYRTFRTLVDSATSFFDERRNDVLDLPPGSGERSTIEAAIGLLAQANSDADAAVDNETLRSRITSLRDGLQGLVEGMDNESEMFIFVKTTVDSLADLFTQVAASGTEPAPSEEAPPEEPSPDSEEAPEDSGADEFPADDDAPTEEPEGPGLDDKNDLATRLGLI